MHSSSSPSSTLLLTQIRQLHSLSSHSPSHVIPIPLITLSSHFPLSSSSPSSFSSLSSLLHLVSSNSNFPLSLSLSLSHSIDTLLPSRQFHHHHSYVYNTIQCDGHFHVNGHLDLKYFSSPFSSFSSRSFSSKGKGNHNNYDISRKNTRHQNTITRDGTKHENIMIDETNLSDSLNQTPNLNALIADPDDEEDAADSVSWIKNIRDVEESDNVIDENNKISDDSDSPPLPLNVDEEVSRYMAKRRTVHRIVPVASHFPETVPSHSHSSSTPFPSLSSLSPTTENNNISSPPSPPLSFSSLGIHSSLISTLSSFSPPITNPTNIQLSTIPSILDPSHRHPLIISSSTGGGKTLSFVLPILTKLYNSTHDNVLLRQLPLLFPLYESVLSQKGKAKGKMGIRAIFVAPNNVLALQLHTIVKKLLDGIYKNNESKSKDPHHRILQVLDMSPLGGTEEEVTKRLLTGNFDIIVSTPKRMINIFFPHLAKVRHKDIKKHFIKEKSSALSSSSPSPSNPSAPPSKKTSFGQDEKSALLPTYNTKSSSAVLKSSISKFLSESENDYDDKQKRKSEEESPSFAFNDWLTRRPFDSSHMTPATEFLLTAEYLVIDELDLAIDTEKYHDVREMYKKMKATNKFLPEFKKLNPLAILVGATATMTHGVRKKIMEMGWNGEEIPRVIRGEKKKSMGKGREGEMGIDETQKALTVTVAHSLVASPNLSLPENLVHLYLLVPTPPFSGPSLPSSLSSLPFIPSKLFTPSDLERKRIEWNAEGKNIMMKHKEKMRNSPFGMKKKLEDLYRETLKEHKGRDPLLLQYESKGDIQGNGNGSKMRDGDVERLSVGMIIKSKMRYIPLVYKLYPQVRNSLIMIGNDINFTTHNTKDNNNNNDKSSSYKGMSEEMQLRNVLNLCEGIGFQGIIVGSEEYVNHIQKRYEKEMNNKKETITHDDDNDHDDRPVMYIATESVIRGLDLPHVDIVFIFSPYLVSDSRTYIHIAGRTARAGRKGYVISLSFQEEIWRLRPIVTDLGVNLKQITWDSETIDRDDYHERREMEEKGKVEMEKVNEEGESEIEEAKPVESDDKVEMKDPQDDIYRPAAIYMKNPKIFHSAEKIENPFVVKVKSERQREKEREEMEREKEREREMVRKGEEQREEEKKRIEEQRQMKMNEKAKKREEKEVKGEMKLGGQSKSPIPPPPPPSPPLPTDPIAKFLFLQEKKKSKLSTEKQKLQNPNPSQTPSPSPPIIIAEQRANANVTVTASSSPTMTPKNSSSSPDLSSAADSSSSFESSSVSLSAFVSVSPSSALSPSPSSVASSDTLSALPPSPSPSQSPPPSPTLPIDIPSPISPTTITPPSISISPSPPLSSSSSPSVSISQSSPSLSLPAVSMKSPSSSLSSTAEKLQSLFEENAEKSVFSQSSSSSSSSSSPSSSLFARSSPVGSSSPSVLESHRDKFSALPFLTSQNSPSPSTTTMTMTMTREKTPTVDSQLSSLSSTLESSVSSRPNVFTASEAQTNATDDSSSSRFPSRRLNFGEQISSQTYWFPEYDDDDNWVDEEEPLERIHRLALQERDILLMKAERAAVKLIEKRKFSIMKRQTEKEIAKVEKGQNKDGEGIFSSKLSEVKEKNAEIWESSEDNESEGNKMGLGDDISLDIHTSPSLSSSTVTRLKTTIFRSLVIRRRMNPTTISPFYDPPMRAEKIIGQRDQLSTKVINVDDMRLVKKKVWSEEEREEWLKKKERIPTFLTIQKRSKMVNIRKKLTFARKETGKNKMG